ncbi:hypothetical protein V1514DRAFT_318824 [Lipomyces japonicus]|uniref:uncharacterized protein n=1 Tax=Lipomyces japonicus TaxID=56871 RepID=UPI0034CDFF2F
MEEGSDITALRRLPVTDDLRRQFERDLAGLTRFIDRDLRQRITSVHANAKHISTQSKHLRAQTFVLARDTRTWHDVAARAGAVLKQAGDVQNWAEILQVEICGLEEAARLVHEEHERQDE